MWRSLEAVPASWPRPGGASVVTFGTFDGVHRGHRTVLDSVVAVARERALPSAAVTFSPHPLAVVRPEAGPVPLVTAARRLELLSEAGLDAALELEFTAELAALDARWFVEDVLVGALRAAAVVVGDDARFGKAGEGDLDLLRELGAERGVDVVGLGRVGDWSSTSVRRAVAAGDVGAAAQVLGRPHRVEGTVVHGDHRGRELGYPTANLADIEVAVPADGVYAAWMVRLDPPAATPPGDRVLPAAVSIGTNPTFDGAVSRGRRVEAHALGRTDLHLYGEHLAVDLVARLRPTLRFDGVAELVEQMERDTAESAAALRAGTLGGP